MWTWLGVWSLEYGIQCQAWFSQSKNGFANKFAIESQAWYSIPVLVFDPKQGIMNTVSTEVYEFGLEFEVWSLVFDLFRSGKV